MTFARRGAASGPTVTTWRIPGGDAGVRRTVAHMRELARERTPLLAEVAADIVFRTGGDPGAVAVGIRDFVSAAVRYVPDAWNSEVVRSPTYTLRRIVEQGFSYGDCDDMATLAGALGLAAGLPVRYVLVGFQGGPWEHVYTEIWTAGGWVEVDPSKPEDWQRNPSDRTEAIPV